MAKAVVVTNNGQVLVKPTEAPRNPITGKPMPMPASGPAPGWKIPDWSQGPSGPYGEQGPFARPF